MALIANIIYVLDQILITLFFKFRVVITFLNILNRFTIFKIFKLYHQLFLLILTIFFIFLLLIYCKHSQYYLSYLQQINCLYFISIIQNRLIAYSQQQNQQCITIDLIIIKQPQQYLNNKLCHFLTINLTTIITHTKQATEYQSTMKYTTINTFHRVPSLTQIFAYILVAVQTCIISILIIPSYASQAYQIVFIVLYAVTGAGLFITVTICSCIDPSDTVMITCKNGDRSQYSGIIDQLLYCQHCQTYVQKGSRHCRKCDRCTQNFDHHCTWINNCIGSKNYRIFIAMIICACANMLVFISSTAVLASEQEWKQNHLGEMITGFVIMAIIIVFTILVINLILLHIYLICKGYTTYEFILARKQSEKVQEQNQVKMGNDQRQEQLRRTVEKQRNQLQKRYESARKEHGLNQGQIYPLQLPEQQKTPRNQEQMNDTNSKIFISRHFAPSEQLVYVRNSSIKVGEIIGEQINASKPQNRQTVSIMCSGSIGDSDRNQSEGQYSVSDLKKRGSLPHNQTSNEYFVAAKSKNKRMNRFFIKNKSLKMFIGSDEALLPSMKALNQTQFVGESKYDNKSMKNSHENASKLQFDIKLSQKHKLSNKKHKAMNQNNNEHNQRENGNQANQNQYIR